MRRKKFIFLTILTLFGVMAARFIYYTYQAISSITYVALEEGIIEEKYTYDGAYKMVVELEKVPGLSYISVKIFDEKKNKEVYLLNHTYCAWDFKWITWEKESYNFWIKSGDLGTFCYEYGYNDWNEIGLTGYLEKYYGDFIMEMALEAINKKLPDEYEIEIPMWK